MSEAFLKILEERGYLVADGAMGTSLFRRGLETGDAPELWNVDFPERVASVHQEFIDAGCDIVLTNTFGGNTYRLKLHKSEERSFELALAAARIARGVADKSDRPVFVGGSIGPTGELLEPNGPLTYEEARLSFALMSRGLAEGGADFLWVETMSSKEEVAAAVDGAATAGLPVIATMTFDTNGKTMMGLSPEDAYDHLTALETKPIAIGANCGLGASENVLSLLDMRNVTDESAVVVAKANCGVPQFKDGEFSFTGTPELMASYARLARDAGARIIGGCCGSDGVVMKAIVESLDGYVPGAPPTPFEVVKALGATTYLNEEEALTGKKDPAEPKRPRRNRRRSDKQGDQSA